MENLECMFEYLIPFTKSFVLDFLHQYFEVQGSLKPFNK